MLEKATQQNKDRSYRFENRECGGRGGPHMTIALRQQQKARHDSRDDERDQPIVSDQIAITMRAKKTTVATRFAVSSNDHARLTGALRRRRCTSATS